MLQDEQQTRKQINQIFQEGQTYLYSLLCDGKKAEGMIFDRQTQQKLLLSLALKSKELGNHDVVREVRDDEKDKKDEEDEDSGGEEIFSI